MSAACFSCPLHDDVLDAAATVTTVEVPRVCWLALVLRAEGCKKERGETKGDGKRLKSWTGLLL